MHKYRAEKIEEEERKNAELYERAQILSKWLSVLFKVEIVSVVLNLVLDGLTMLLPNFTGVDVILNGIMSIIRVDVLLKMVSVQWDYRRSAVFMLISIPFAVIPVFINSDSAVLSVLFGLPDIVISTLSLYYMYNAHSWVCADVDAFLSERWTLMWKLHIALIVLTFVSPILLLFGLLGILALLAAVVGSLVVGILELYYLWHTAALFKDIAD